MSFIEFKDVKKTYRVGEVDIKALDGVNFTIDKGELVIIAGASGAGKSTVLNLLGGMDLCTSGVIEVDGRKINQEKEHQLTDYRRYDIGFVFQFYNLIQNLTAIENVELATQISKDPFKAEDIIEQVGLLERKDNFPSQLSGGEQQRVAIARALGKNPKLLLCDEPTGALDYNTGRQILKLLQDSCKKYNMTVVLITHNLSLCPLGNKVILMKNGQVSSIKLNPNPKSIDEIEW